MCAVECPGNGLAEGLARDGPTGLADGHQASVRPVTDPVVRQLPYQRGVRQHDEVHVPGLAHPVAQLTRAHAV